MVSLCFLLSRRRILFQTAVAVEKENALRHSNLLCSTLKSVVQQFSNVDSIKQQLCYTRQALTSKTRKMKALSAEANVKYNEIKEKDNNISELRHDLFNKKQILLREKRDKQKLKNQLEIIKNQLNLDQFERPLSNPISHSFMYKASDSRFRCHSANILE